jgi:hypothetical protein
VLFSGSIDMFELFASRKGAPFMTFPNKLIFYCEELSSPRLTLGL